MANYPGAVSSFSAKSDGAGNKIFASHVNGLQDEITAIEDALLNGIAHVLPVNAAIKFPATQAASADVNTLDDYEEGSWTPVIAGTGGTAGQNYAIQVGRYVKIGKYVYIVCQVALTTYGTVTGNPIITGLPFTAENTSNEDHAIALGFWATGASTFTNMLGLIAHNSTAIALYAVSSAAATPTILVSADLANGAALFFSGSYRATA